MFVGFAFCRLTAICNYCCGVWVLPAEVYTSIAEHRDENIWGYLAHMFLKISLRWYEFIHNLSAALYTNLLIAIIPFLGARQMLPLSSLLDGFKNASLKKFKRRKVSRTLLFLVGWEFSCLCFGREDKGGRAKSSLVAGANTVEM